MSSSPSTSRFATLLLREWMQHKRGWLITLLLPPALFLALLPFGEMQGAPDSPLVVGLVPMLITPVALFAITWISAMFQLPGLARRDVQDRSIEFWLSLPASHAESIGATLLTHVLLVPLTALATGYLLGVLMSFAVVLKIGGLAGWAHVPWLQVLSLSLPLLLRAVAGVLLMTLWLAPLMLVFMAASAWLKRWGVPAVLLSIGIGGALLTKLYGNPIVWELLSAQRMGALRALMDAPHDLARAIEEMGSGGAPFASGSWALQDLGSALQQAASPNFVGGLLLAAACFGLLVLRRRRAA